MKMPALFIGHGSPMLAISPNESTAYWQSLAATMPRPRAIVCISAHWVTRGTSVTAQKQPEMIYDMYGFPEALYQVQYPAKGDPVLARQTAALLGDAVTTETWGLDHGAWSVLKYLYPDADVPVVQLSLNADLDAAQHFELAKKLRVLREDGILILGSGNIVHNLRELDRRHMEENVAWDWAQRASDWVVDAIERRDWTALCHYEQAGGDVRRAVADPDHYWPLLYVLAQSTEDEPVQASHRVFQGGALDMTCVRVG